MQKTESQIIQELLETQNRFGQIGNLGAVIARQIISLRYVQQRAGVMSGTYFDKYANEFISQIEKADAVLSELKSIQQQFDSLERDVIYTLAEQSENHINKKQLEPQKV